MKPKEMYFDFGLLTSKPIQTVNFTEVISKFLGTKDWDIVLYNYNTKTCVVDDKELYKFGSTNSNEPYFKTYHFHIITNEDWSILRLNNNHLFRVSINQYGIAFKGEQNGSYWPISSSFEVIKSLMKSKSKVETDGPKLAGDGALEDFVII